MALLTVDTATAVVSAVAASQLEVPCCTEGLQRHLLLRIALVPATAAAVPSLTE